MRIASTIALIAAITAAAAPALACTPRPRCELVALTGEIPCVELIFGEDGCYIEAALTCERDQAASIWLDGSEQSNYRGGEYPTFFHLGDSGILTASHTLSWTLDDQSGVVTIYTSELPYADDPCGGLFCAATPPQRPSAPLTALLPLILGALMWRRHTTSSR